MQREVKVGITVVAAVVLLALGVFTIGDRANLFAHSNTYTVRFLNVGGLAAGNPVQLNGVNVGRVEEIFMPERIEEEKLTVRLTVDRRYQERVRRDSLARIKTLGLLGDKYIEITSGSPGQERIPDGGEIPAAPATDVDELIASGEDMVENVVAISVSLRNILARMEAGQGLLGELTTDTDAGRRAKEGILEIVDSVRRVTRQIETGDGTLAALVADDTLLRRAEGTLDRLEALLGSMDEGDGALPALIHDAATRERVQQTVADLGDAASSFAEVSARLKEGDGLLPKLLSDEEFSRQVTEDLRELIQNLNRLSEKLEQGEGTLGQFINDPQVYEAVDDILVGIDESWLLRWLVRNRQKAGIKKRFEEEIEAQGIERDEAAAAVGEDGG
ncbi:MAG: MlaD family protein [Thermoanaerobaculia bacterium]|nr:MlaD family protein [Thermoanaerobaculia bacterium]